MSTAKTTQTGGAPSASTPGSSAPSHPARPSPRRPVRLCLHLPAGMQHEVPVQLAQAVEAIFTLCAVVGALLLLLLLLPPGGSALPSPRRPPPFLPEGPAFRGWCFLGGYRRAAEPARWGARRGLPEGRAATELAGLGWGAGRLGRTGGPPGRAPTAPTQALLHLVAGVILRVVSGLLLLLFLLVFLLGVWL